MGGFLQSSLRRSGDGWFFPVRGDQISRDMPSSL